MIESIGVGDRGLIILIIIDLFKVGFLYKIAQIAAN